MKSMRKKLIVYGSIGIFAAGVCLLLFFNKKNGNEKENVPMLDDAAIGTDVESEIESTNLTDILEGSENDTVTEPTETDTNMPDTEEDDADYVLYLEDEGVRDNPVFAAFIDKEITAFDAETEKNKDIYECFRECAILPSREIPPVSGIHYMSEDLDGDGKDELLVLLQWNDTDGDLLVFHEADGELYQWETWDDFLWMRMSSIEYYGNGIFSQGGGAGDIVGRYNAEGKIEYIVDYGTWQVQEEGEWITKNSLVVYKDGMEEKTLVWEGPPYWGDESWGEITPENLIIKDECAAIMEEIWEELGEGTLIYEIECEENAQKIPLTELFGN
ncbi:MAG: hypothetical protein HDQ99_14015 [Lachnospiraceae bacterium]|nr:hypothetical protein [Lachnospiraceae bacterium]